VDQVLQRTNSYTQERQSFPYGGCNRLASEFLKQIFRRQRRQCTAGRRYQGGKFQFVKFAIIYKENFRLKSIRLSERRDIAGEGAASGRNAILDIRNRSISAQTQNRQANDEDETVEDRQSNVLPGSIPLSFLDELEPEQGREVEREARNE